MVLDSATPLSWRAQWPRDGFLPARRQSAEVIKLRSQGAKAEQIAAQLGISRIGVQGFEGPL